MHAEDAYNAGVLFQSGFMEKVDVGFDQNLQVTYLASKVQKHFECMPRLMKGNRETKRLFVGGLGQNISEVDLQTQFSRCGEVSDVEIITRKDDQGNPQKVFAYINVRIAETDLKKWMSVLNKTKWKGGTLQIQLTKESFLHSLAQEREEAKAKKEKSTIGNTNSLEKIGMVDFHVKAVPGTEVPGHKDGPPEDKRTHIIFGSDSESETKETSTWEQSHLAEKPVKEFLSRTSGKLFDSSDEESDAEDNSSRFRIKPQFEGRAGKKLMDLQSHFGTDDRFRMDSRFLESDSEEEQEEVDEKKTTENEELAAEKLKALNIVQSILHTNLSNSTSKGSVAAKKFKDIIHYDPTRHDHATYEKKRDDKPKKKDVSPFFP
ncbi:nucleolar protein 8 isoform 2-T4 [Molossus nigricans]